MGYLGGGGGEQAVGDAEVLVAQGLVAQVEVEACRVDVAVPGLLLERLERHAGLAQHRQAGVAQAVAGQRGGVGAGR